MCCCQFAQAQTPQKMGPGMLWEIKSGKNVVHLFGSIHLAKPDFYPMPKHVDDAFLASKLLVVEADITAPNVMPIMKRHFSYVAPDKLENHLSPSAWSTLQLQFGNAVESYQNTKLGALNTALTVAFLAQHGYAADQGIDLHYLQRAKAAKKPIAELEGAEFQARLFAHFSDADGEAWLLQVLQDAHSGELLREMEDMAQAWLAGDEAQLAQMVQKAMEKDALGQKLQEVFLTKRNLGLSNKIGKLLKEGKQAFIVMGAGHCVGSGNVVELLQKQGFSVRRIDANNAATATTATLARQ